MDLRFSNSISNKMARFLSCPGSQGTPRGRFRVKSPLYYRNPFEADSVSGSVCGSSVISEHTCVSSASLLSPLSPNPTCDDGPDGNCSPHVMLPDGASALSALTLQLKGAWKSDFACTKNSKDVSDSDEKSGDKQNSDCDDVNRQDHKYSSEID